jgi:hypothetical protein
MLAAEPEPTWSHESPEPHALPHAPQSASVSSARQLLLQHASPEPHALPHAPQFAGSPSVARQPWSQQLWPLPHSAVVLHPVSHVPALPQ